MEEKREGRNGERKGVVCQLDRLLDSPTDLIG